MTLIISLVVVAVGTSVVWERVSNVSGPEGSGPTGMNEGATAVGEVVEAAHRLEREVCADVGYLCAHREAEGESFRILRWPETTPRLVVHFEAPAHEDPDLRAPYVAAAVRGIQAWDGHPFPLMISDRESSRPSEADIVVRWASQLDGTALGLTRSRWESTASGGGTFTQMEIVLATRNPFSARHSLDSDAVRLVAAHEMGHALGLPHSDQELDLMYPRNTADRLTPRDYRTLGALYQIPNGTLIKRNGPSS